MSRSRLSKPLSPPAWSDGVRRKRRGTETQTRADIRNRKDKTLVEILDRVKTIEGKIDRLGSIGAHYPGSHAESSTQPSPSVAQTRTADAAAAHHPARPISLHVPDSASASSGGEEQYRYVSSVHQMLGWPVVRQLLDAYNTKPGFDPDLPETDGTTTVLGLRYQQPLPAYTTPEDINHIHGLPDPGAASFPITAAALNWETMEQLSRAYFDSFNFLYPILDRESFVSEIMVSVVNNGFDEGMPSTIAFLVFALGEVAVAGLQGLPLHLYNHTPSGFRGGTVDHPPGLALFNEARRRMGFHLTNCSLENIQIFALARHV